MKTITAANAEFAIAITGLYPVPQRLEQYAADAAFTTDAVEIAETVMGVDGFLSAGYTPKAIKQTITLAPNSPSLQIFNNWALAMIASREVLEANGSIIIASLGAKYVLTRGFLTSYRALPDAKQVMQPVEYQITWNTIAGGML